jgi:PAS domain S-box-containing protein
MPADEKRLRDVEIRNLIDFSPIVHYLARPAGCYALTFVSAGSEANMGFAAERLTADPAFWLSRVHPEDRERVAHGAACVIEQGQHRQEYRFQHASGAWIWQHDEATLIRDEAGAPLAVSGAWLDITDRKRAELTLGRQKVFLESLFENAPTIVLILDERGRITKVNPYFEAKTGYRAAELVGRDWFETLLPPGDQREIRTLFNSVLERGVNAGHVNPIVAKDGRLLQIEWFAQTLTDADGQFNGLLNIGHDVTERIEYEKALEASKREAERANAAKSRFLITASHDLRQPLQTLLLLNGSLARTTCDDQQKHMLEMQSQALKGMSKLLNALLDIGKLESGAIQPRITDVPVSELFKSVEAEFAALAHAKGLQLVIDDCSLVARTDADLLRQLVQNVVANAVRYTREGSVRLGCRAQADRLEITVRDTGIGIPEDQREAIFDEFYQVDRTTSNGGLGLGLAIVKRIVTLLDAGIDVQSEVGKGTAFCFSIARGDDAALAPAATQSVDRPKTGGAVLLVDDDAAVLAASKLFLEIEGYDVVAAASPREARAAIADGSRKIDLIVTDYHLNDTETGIDIVAAVRRILGRTIPAILVTGDTSPSVGAVALTRLEMMTKPIDTNQLLIVARDLLVATPQDEARAHH